MTVGTTEFSPEDRRRIDSAVAIFESNRERFDSLARSHTDQIRVMHPRILAVLEANRYRVVGRPVAYCWDVEYKALFQEVGLHTEEADSLYTTVHYDVQSSHRSPITCELQVRSLADEVWGEVSHRVNYPVQSPSEACRDQLKVLARLTSGCGRLVDSIFKTHGDVAAAARR